MCVQHAGQSWEKLAVVVLVVDLDILLLIFHAPAQEPCPVISLASGYTMEKLRLLSLPAADEFANECCPVGAVVCCLLAFFLYLKKKGGGYLLVLLK